MLQRAIQENLPRIFGLVFFWFSAKDLSTIQADEGACGVVRTIEFKNVRLSSDLSKMYCNMGKVECFFKCLNIPQCLSFAVAMNASCSGPACLLYSKSRISDRYFLQDSSSTYYFMQSSCCHGACLNGGECQSKKCTCACPKEHSSTNCICPRYNVTKSFSHKWKLVSESTHINQIDSGRGWTWATGPWGYYAPIYALQNDNWVTITGHLTHVTVGKSGVWGVNSVKLIFFREAVTSSMPHGNNWRKLTGELIQIDAGSSGVVYGVNSFQQIFCRTGISDQLPYGNRDWLQIPGTFKYVSCGDYGCWAIRPDNSIAFRTGVTSDYPQGTGWLDVDGSFVQLEAGYQGRVYAVSPDNVLYHRIGICAIHPTGSTWRKVKGLEVKHVTVGDSSLFVIAANGSVFMST